MKGHNLQVEPERRNVILMVGRTGVGKSTLAEMLFGDLSALECIRDPEYPTRLKLVNKRYAERKAPGTEKSELISKTICPVLFADPLEPNVAIYDCPGFADTRGTSNEIATGLFLGSIFKEAENVKLVVTVGHEAVQPYGDRKLFTENVLPEVLDFVKNVNIYQGGVFLLVNKLHNPDGDFTQDEEIQTIATFLREVQHLAHSLSSCDEKWRERRPALDALLQASLLVQTDDGKYPNIRFIKKIRSTGPLKDMPNVEECRIRIREQLLDSPNFKFVPCKPQDFGSPLSPEAKKELYQSQIVLADQVERIFTALADKVVGQFKNSRSNKMQMSSFTRYFADYLDDLDELEGTAAAGLGSQSLQLLCRFSTRINLDIKSEFERLEECAKKLSFLSGIDLKEIAKSGESVEEKMMIAKDRMVKDVRNSSGVFFMFPNGLSSQIVR